MGTAVTAEAAEARNAYMRQYRSRNRDRINAKQREWRAKNPEKAKEYQKRYWQRKSAERSIRLPWKAYGITSERRKELVRIAKQKEYADLVFAAAIKADRQVAPYIVLSVADGVSYDYLEYHGKLGRCPVGRSNFYGIRRYFFHCLDAALREKQTERMDGLSHNGGEERGNHG